MFHASYLLFLQSCMFLVFLSSGSFRAQSLYSASLCSYCHWQYSSPTITLCHPCGDYRKDIYEIGTLLRPFHLTNLNSLERNVHKKTKLNSLAYERWPWLSVTTQRNVLRCQETRYGTMKIFCVDSASYNSWCLVKESV